MRINARLDDDAAEKLDEIQRTTGLSLSDVVREAIEHYYAEVRDRTERDAAALDALVGAFEGSDDSPADLSADYKRYLCCANLRVAARSVDPAEPKARRRNWGLDAPSSG